MLEGLETGEIARLAIIVQMYILGFYGRGKVGGGGGRSKAERTFT